ncbi:MAG: tetratricopeptide repeat protein [Cyanobacteria bacterium HKST-UBA02]|nr:tetratricopeptide repeat protein [Cyanobacteria bacterium HKST-UBA02]
MALNLQKLEQNLAIKLAALVAGSLITFLSPVAAQADQPPVKEFTYEDALKALEQTKEHSKAAESWGTPRTVAVPDGVDPNKVIEQKAIKVPGILGLDKTGPDHMTPITVDPTQLPKPTAQSQTPEANPESAFAAAATTQAKPAAAQAPTPGASNEQPGGWDWLQSQENAGQTPNGAAGNAVQPVSNTPVSSAGAPVPSRAPQSTMTTTYEAPVATQAAARAQEEEQILDQEQEPEQAQAQEPDQEQAPAQAAAPAEETPKDAVACYNRAIKLHLSGKLDQAIEEYGMALQANPELGQAHCNLGLIYNQQHRYDEAIAEFRKALAINPQDAITYNGIGAALRAKNDLDGAIKNWQTAISLKDDLATAHYNLGAAYEMRKEYDKALDQYQRATESDNRLGEAYYRTGLIMSRENRLEDAKEQFTKALKVSDKADYSEDARRRLATLEQKSQ